MTYVFDGDDVRDIDVDDLKAILDCPVNVPLSDISLRSESAIDSARLYWYSQAMYYVVRVCQSLGLDCRENWEGRGIRQGADVYP